MQQFVHVSLVFTELLTNSILNKKNKKEKASNSSSYPYTVCRMAFFVSAWLLMECRSLGCTTLDVCPFGRCPHCVFDTTSLLKIRYCATTRVGQLGRALFNCLQQQGSGTLAGSGLSCLQQQGLGTLLLPPSPFPHCGSVKVFILYICFGQELG